MFKFLTYLSLLAFSLSPVNAKPLSLKLGLGAGINSPENSDQSQTGAKPWVRYYFGAQFNMYFDLTFFDFFELTAMPQAAVGFGRYDYSRGGTNVSGLKANISETSLFYGARLRFKPQGFTPFLGAGLISGSFKVAHEFEDFREQNNGADAANGNEEKKSMTGQYGEIGFDYTWKHFGLRAHLIIYRKRTDSFLNMGDNQLTFEGGLIQTGLFWMI